MHSLFSFFQSTLTVPKIKDLVHRPSQQYETIQKILSKQPIDNNLRESSGGTRDANDVGVNHSTNNMKDTLKSFLQSQTV